MLQWLEKYWKQLRELRLWVVEHVLWAEKELKGKSGKEKRSVIVGKLDELVRLPFWLEWVDGPLIGFLVDLACDKLNWLTDHNFEDIEPNSEQRQMIADVLEAPITTSSAVGKNIDERLNELYSKYGIKPDAPDVVEKAADGPAPAGLIAEKPAGDLSQNFSRREFACKCGCGKDDISPELVDICQAIRDYIGVPLCVNSGCRCEKHNAKVGGVKNSYHVQGKAADLACTLGARKLFQAIRELYDLGKIPGLEYCLLYPSFVHIDIGKKRAERFAKKE